jgi:hypothetical protein
MTPENLLRSMCERHGLPADYGRRLLPLVRKAMDAPDEVRERILALVDGNLANRAQGSAELESHLEGTDQEVLVAVARVLHDWTPSEPMLDLGSTLGGLGAQGPETA